ncbi:MAG: DUF2784 domain-containing protein [Pseudomonadota bacterium]
MSQTNYALAADAVLALHTMFVAFVVFGLVLVLLGGWRDWLWVRNRWFRGIHLLAIAVVVVQAWMGRVCFLTTWEMALRAKADQATYPGAFIAHWLEQLLYYQAPGWVFATAYTAFALLVMVSWFMVPPGGKVDPLP